jgi:hypothetical protein
VGFIARLHHVKWDDRTVPVPIDSGCHVLPASDFSGNSVTGFLSTNGALVSLVEECQNSFHLVVTDLEGRVVTDVDSGPGNWEYRAVLTGDLLAFDGGGFRKGAGPSYSYAEDLRTGRFVVLGSPQPNTGQVAVKAAGRYVLWYDAKGGHVGKLDE